MNESSKSEPSKGESTKAKLFQLLMSLGEAMSLGLIFSTVLAVVIFYASYSLMGCDVRDANATALIDWNDLTQVRIFLWSFAAMIGVGLSLATYTIKDSKLAAIYTVGYMAFWILRKPMLGLEVATAIIVCLSLGWLGGWVLNRVTSKAALPPARSTVFNRVAGRIFVLVTVLTFLFFYTRNSTPLWVSLPSYVIVFSMYCSVGVQRICRLVKADMDLNESANAIAV